MTLGGQLFWKWGGAALFFLAKPLKISMFVCVYNSKSG